MVSAESPIDYLQEEVETEWTKEKLEADFIEKYMMEEGSVKDSLPEEAADKMKRYLYITEEDRELVLDKMEETCN